MLKIYNSKSNKKEEFVPLDPNHIKFYVCGPTVYNEIHIGNARSAIVFDLLNRVLRLLYPKVTYVRNITDVDDKIIAKAHAESKGCEEVARFWEASYQKNCELLQLLTPDYQPRATEVIHDIIVFISKLMDEGFAYEKDGSVFFRINELKTYGEISNNKALLEACRVGENKDKESQHDFVLWKPSKVGEPYWKSPWGEGRPGWHIECSAMSLKYLGVSFDIHGGGQDLLFPHHENENAQNKALNGDIAGPRYWMHNAMLLMNKEKMSKSIGNIVLLSDLFKQYHPIFVKFYILHTHYRHVLNFDTDTINMLALKFDNWVYHLGECFMSTTYVVTKQDVVELFEDLNAPGFFVRFEAKLNGAVKDKDVVVLHECAAIMNFLGLNVVVERPSEAVHALAQERLLEQKSGNFARADELRKEIEEAGFVIADAKEKYILKFKFNSKLSD